MERGRRIKLLDGAMRPKDEPETQASPRGRSGRSPSPRRSRSPRTLEDILKCEESPVPPRKLVKKEKKEKKDKETEETKKRRLMKMRQAGIMIIVPTWGPDCCAACKEPVKSYEKNWTSSEGGVEAQNFRADRAGEM